MKQFTEFQLQQFEGYQQLKDLGFNYGEIQIFYNTPKSKRVFLLTNKMVTKKSKRDDQKRYNEKLKEERKVKKIDTQMCTDKGTLLEQVEKMANEYMKKDFEVDGVIYNMTDLFYTFSFNDLKNTLGQFEPSRRRIHLSRWIIENSVEPMETWKQTMIHEIAHAIDYKKRGKSDHSDYWLRVAREIGYLGKRLTMIRYKKGVMNSKYTLSCTTCGREKPRHKISDVTRLPACRVCCDKHSNGKFNPKYRLTLTKNY